MRAGRKFIRRAKITNGEMQPAKMTVNYREDQEEPVEIVFKVDEAEGKTQQLLMARMSGTEALRASGFDTSNAKARGTVEYAGASDLNGCS